MAALAYAKDPKYHGRTKHIDIRYHYIRDIVAKKEVVLKHISTSQMIVDSLTKPIVRDAHMAHVRSLGLRRLRFFLLTMYTGCILLGILLFIYM
jgi:hypothetical protein